MGIKHIFIDEKLCHVWVDFSSEDECVKAFIELSGLTLKSIESFEDKDQAWVWVFMDNQLSMSDFEVK
jgi:hypothetical protein